MKRKFNVIGIGILFIGASIFTSCTKDGPMGPAGAAGTNGTNGTDGKDANASCLVCHTSSNMDTKLAEYKLSKHFLGNTSARNTKYCARCHTSEGFQQVVGNGQSVVANDMPTANRINCSTCHSHSAFDFTGDTVSQILATTSPVYLNYNKNLTSTDFGKINNLCVTCHQIRGATATVYSDTTLRPQVINKAFTQLPFFPFVVGDDNASVNYQNGQSFSVHDGNQSNLVAGINGYEYSGKTYTRTWKHSDFSCTDCHMNAYDPIKKVGGHSLLVNEDACAKCHTSDHIATTQALIDAKIVELRNILVARKVFGVTYSKTSPGPSNPSYSAVPTHDFNGKLYLTTASSELFASTASNNTVSATTGLVVYGNILKYAKDASKAATASASSVIGSDERIGRPWKMGELGAAYNYGYINSELSKGVHNPTYALQLLQNSIDWLNANPVSTK